MIPQFQVRYHDGKDDTCFTAFLRCPYTMEKNLYRQTTVGYWFCMFVTNSLSRRTGLQINLRQLHSVPCATRYASLPAPTSCVQAFTHRRFYTQTLLHTDAFTHKSFYTQTVLRTDASTRRCGKSTHKIFYTQTLLHMVLLHKHTLTHRRFDTQKPLHTNAFTHGRFYTQTLLHTDAFTHRRFYTQKLLHTDGFTHRRFYTQTLLHADAFYTRTHAFTHKRFYTQTR